MSRESGFQKPTTLAIEIARHLREAVIRGILLPASGSTRSRMMQDLALSRSPVREAIRILEAEGLVTIEPHRGAYVRPLSEQGPGEIFDVRLMIETHGSGARPTDCPARASSLAPDAVAEARAALVARDFEPWHQASLRFHDGLVALAVNGHLQRLYADLKVSLRRYQISLIGIPGLPERSQAAHEGSWSRSSRATSSGHRPGRRAHHELEGGAAESDRREDDVTYFISSRSFTRIWSAASTRMSPRRGNSRSRMTYTVPARTSANTSM